MEGYIIYLPEYANSVRWAYNALDSAKKHSWNVQLYNGINGTRMKIQDAGLSVYAHSKKTKRLFEKPGVHGCFLSHYQLWKKSVQTNKTIAIFEHDVEFYKPPILNNFTEVLKLEGFVEAKPILPGKWWEGARAYVITPSAANKLVTWVKENGAMPADWMLCDGIVDVKFDNNELVGYCKNTFSFTKDL
jgi:GR25 family glycosyltransferase involved in LPS biosynthesis